LDFFGRLSWISGISRKIVLDLFEKDILSLFEMIILDFLDFLQDYLGFVLSRIILDFWDFLQDNLGFASEDYLRFLAGLS
jgi:hypothetical protein